MLNVNCGIGDRFGIGPDIVVKVLEIAGGEVVLEISHGPEDNLASDAGDTMMLGEPARGGQLC